MSQQKADELLERLLDFASRILQLAARLPKDCAGHHVAMQVLRSGTSAAPNYAEARAAESRADFIHKVSIASKEMNETQVWLKLIIRSDMLKPELVLPLLEENRALAKILTASLKTLRARRNGK